MRKKAINKSLKEKFEIIRHIEKGLANKEAYEKFEVPKNTILTLMKCRVFLRFQSLSSKVRLFASKQANITEFFSKVG